jgi:hypothetical protein
MPVAGSILRTSATVAWMILAPSAVLAQVQTMQSAAGFTDSKLLVAVVTLAGVIFSAILSAGISLFLAWRTAKSAVSKKN